MLRPTVPLIGPGIVTPRLSVVQQGTVRQIHQRTGKVMAAGLVRAAHRQDLFIHQEVMRELRGGCIVKIDGEIDTRTL